MSGPTHKLFLDDSGTKEYAEDRAYKNQGGKTLYFVFAGLLISPAEAGLVNREMRKLKESTFGQPDVEIKANWLRISHERKKRYIDRYGVTDEQLTSFTESVYDLLGDRECKLLACAVNKLEVQQQYRKPHYAPAIAYDCLLQRAQHEMNTCGGQVSVTIDDMSGATPKGRQYLDNLKRQHEILKRSGSPLRKGVTFDRLNDLSFRDSKLDERLQLADLVAYAVYRQFVDHGPEWEQHSGTLPTYEYFNKIARRFRNDGGRIQGYGIVKFPMNRRVLWRIKE